MSTRFYNKLYVHSDREEGSEKLLLGYKNDTSEIVFKKDRDVAFHIPFFADKVNLADSTLIQDGATGGPFPAASDRIFKNNRNYGNVTPHGSTSEVPNGVWYCSWLYEDPNGNAQWMDRFYNPGYFRAATAKDQLLEYVAHNPVYRDVPSKMTLEQGVQYRYFHVGEKYANHMVTTFGGVTGERLALNLDGWTTDTIDTSNNRLPVIVNTNGPFGRIYTINTTETNRTSAYVINFNNEYETTAYVDFNPSFNFIDEFTLSFWAQSDNWAASQSTQLVGNYTDNGGYGLFIDTLSTYPFFVIPETSYGHLLFLNGKFEHYLDKSLHPSPSLTASPMFVAINSDNHVISLNVGSSQRLNKYNHLGRPINQITLPSLTETPMQLMCGRDNDVIIITNQAIYTYNTDFELKDRIIYSSTELTKSTFAYDVASDTAELVTIDNVYDCKFIGTTCYCISADDGNLWIKRENETEFSLFVDVGYGEVATNIGIDPYNRIWLLHENNKITVYDSTTSLVLIETFGVGPNREYASKNINFTCVHDRDTNTSYWKAVVYYGDTANNLVEPELYVVDMEGTITETINILSLFDFYTLTLLNEKQEGMGFFAKGDFTGYEHRRVFNNLTPYSNKAQLIFQTNLKRSDESSLYPFKKFKQYYSLDNWNTNSWQHLVLTLKNRTFTLYNNSIPIINLNYSGEYEMSFESQPSFFVGSPVGFQFGLNYETKKCSSIFNGLIQDIKIYDYAIEQKNLEMFLRQALKASDLRWYVHTPNVQYIETIERFFKNKIPGSKSSFFNIKLYGTGITDPTTRQIIEEGIRNLVSKIQPAYVNFLKVKWID